MMKSRHNTEFVEISGLGEILKTARALSSQKKEWHFHILMPSCRLNNSGRYVLYFENISDAQCHCYYSDTAPLTAGKELVQLLHKVKINAAPTTPAKSSARNISKMIERANQLNSSGKTWHHHMLFPSCRFNDTDKWLLLFEDEGAKNQLLYKSDTEPKEELLLIENLYYKSKH